MQTDGYTTMPLLNADDLDRLAEGYERLGNERPAGFHATMYGADVDKRRAVFEFIGGIVADRVKAQLTGYRLCVANWLVKEASASDSAVAFHQDWTFIDERQARSFNIWIPLVDVDAHNGCLEVVPGTHLESLDHRPHGDACRFSAVADGLRATHTRAIHTPRGHGVFYDGALLHASRPNTSPGRRIAVGTVWIPEGSQLVHCFRISPSEVEVFAVDESFFWRHTPGTRPTGVPLLGVADASASQFGPDVLARLPKRPQTTA